jgi:hypothetical protein
VGGPRRVTGFHPSPPRTLAPERRSRPISRILFHRRPEGGGGTTIPLGPRSLAGSGDLPGGFERAVRQAEAMRHPIWPCSVRGFACHPCCHGRGALLPHLFTLTGRRPKAKAGGMFSVPLIRQVALPGYYPAHCPVEFGLSSHPQLRSDGGQAPFGACPPKRASTRR